MWLFLKLGCSHKPDETCMTLALFKPPELPLNNRQINDLDSLQQWCQMLNISETHFSFKCLLYRNVRLVFAKAPLHFIVIISGQKSVVYDWLIDSHVKKKKHGQIQTEEGCCTQTFTYPVLSCNVCVVLILHRSICIPHQNKSWVFNNNMNELHTEYNWTLSLKLWMEM